VTVVDFKRVTTFGICLTGSQPPYTQSLFSSKHLILTNGFLPPSISPSMVSSPSPSLVRSADGDFSRYYRYIRLIINLISSWTFPPIPLAKAPAFYPSDVTIIIPTLTGEGDEFVDCLESCIGCEPYAIIIVTTNKNVDRLQQLCKTLHSSQVQVLGIEKAGKRQQMIQGLLKVRTALTVFADDDVLWPRTFLKYLLAAFEDPQVGAAGTCQRLRRAAHPSFWNILGAFYLERRNFEMSATSHIDGGISCLSGRTSAYRTTILQNKQFIEGFANERWLGRVPLSTADDDNFLTRWIVSHGWKVKIQYCKEAELTTTLKDSPEYLHQCVRWARTNWRSNITSMFVERYIWRYIFVSTFSDDLLMHFIGCNLGLAMLCTLRPSLHRH